jgi:hypothetical protein
MTMSLTDAALLDEDDPEVTDTSQEEPELAESSDIAPFHSKYPTPRKSIRLHCLSCVADQPSEVEKCQCPDCKLWPWRFGIRPEIAERRGKVTDPEKFVDEYTPAVLRRRKAASS